MTRENLIDAIQRLAKARADAETEAALSRLNEIAPHANISDLMFYCERDRTHEQIADEALLRERIWAEGGDFALQAHIERQMIEALANSSLPETHYTKTSAQMILESIRTLRVH
jgi:hypothetical protein